MLYDNLSSLSQQQRRFDDEFADFIDFSVESTVTTATSELDDYFRSPIENVANPLKWWFDKRRTYPNLSRMARDFLSVPGKSNLIRYLYH
jgi:hypothetical protein